MRYHAMGWFSAAVLLLAFGAATLDGAADAPPPPPVVRVPCTVIEVVDGDTVTVELTLRARVRLLDCWAPESGTAEGAAATDYTRRIAHGRDAMLEIDLDPMRRLDDAFSFGRLLARIYVDGDDLGSRIVRAGHATTTKEDR